MLTHTYLSIIRRSELLKRFGISNTCLHDRIKEGVMPPPISLGGRSVGWLQHELDALMAAMAKGEKKSQLKKLVSDLVIHRQNLALSIDLEPKLGGAK